jgi:hypothetical protein
MNTKNVIGKRIVAVDQQRFYNASIGRMDNEVLAIVLEDGTRLAPYTIEREDGRYAQDLSVYAAEETGDE